MINIKTLGELKASGYKPISVKEELRKNLISKLRSGEKIFSGIVGYDDTVLPDVERAILSRHNILLLGLRGQAKTRIARLMVNLLDEYIPVIEGSELNEDPMNPISKWAEEQISTQGDSLPISWLHRDERYVEKLATPDVSIADLIGDVDPIKAATLKLSYNDEKVIHYGLIPRAHRSLFVINELPDLQPRIQVALFNILQEGDLQIRGFKLRLPLDIEFLFTANPEDYTNRGSIITPLKDRIESQILTHYPTNPEDSRAIIEQESNIHKDQSNISIYDLHSEMLVNIAFEARESEFVDEKSGVSARLSISALENLYSTVERRTLLNNEQKAYSRITDFWGIIPAITGKIELVYEGEQEGAYNVAMHIMSKVIKETFLAVFGNPNEYEEGRERDPFGAVIAFFADGNTINLLNDDNEVDYREKLDSIPGLDSIAQIKNAENEAERYALKELILHGLAEFEIISKQFLDRSIQFEDPLGDIFNDL